MIKICNCCKEEKSIDKFSKDKNKKDGLHSNCKLCSARISKEHRRLNTHSIREKKALKYKLSKDSVIEKVKEYYYNNLEDIKLKRKEYRQNNKDKIYLRNKEYQESNRQKVRSWSNKRRARKILRTPPWITKEQYIEIESFYEYAQKLTSDTGILYHVDHIVPLKGDRVSGLHVPWNLQVITAKENLEKSNKFVI